jgi:hypothetical protein
MALYHQTVDFLSDSLANRRTQLPLLAVTGASFTLGLLLRSILSRGDLSATILPSPRSRLLADLSDEENRTLPLPNDVLPGARDVASPYGSIRVYEWGREDGPKVLLVHGITTPCIALGGVAHALVDRGCRVMLFDLYVLLKSVNCFVEELLMIYHIALGEDTPTARLIFPRTIDSLQHRSCLP